jgi:hypothetical protein
MGSKPHATDKNEQVSQTNRREFKASARTFEGAAGIVPGCSSWRLRNTLFGSRRERRESGEHGPL